MRWSFALFLATPLLTSCVREGVTPPPQDQLAPGTWGGEDVGIIADESTAHIHIGCTNGNFPRPTELQLGKFSVAGEYVLRAFPVQVGPPLPAQFAGELKGSTLTFTVAVNDTVEKRLQVLGPVTVRLGKEPRMGPCPICRSVDRRKPEPAGYSGGA